MKFFDVRNLSKIFWTSDGAATYVCKSTGVYTITTTKAHPLD
jgi:hypothetical protein